MPVEKRCDNCFFSTFVGPQRYPATTKPMLLCVVATLRSMSHLGYFHDEKQAAEAYDRAAKKYHGVFASLNHPNI